MTWLERIDHDHQALLLAILEALPEPFFLLDREGRYLAVLGGLDDDRYHDGRPLIGKRMHDVLPRETADRFLARVHEALDNGRTVTYEYELSSDEVEGVDERPGVSDHLRFEAHVAPLASSPGRPDMVVWLIFNITERRLAVHRLEEQQWVLEQQQAELERLVRIDHLTGLLNRRSFFAEAERELQWAKRTGQPVALIMLDLDDFKAINDTWGHAAGDETLRTVSEMLCAEGRSTDVVARQGGEEFAVIVRGAGIDEGARLAERLRAALAALVIRIDDQQIAVTGSFGVTEIRPADHDPDDAVKRADAAMYVAKRRGRNRVEIAPG